jgi:aspartyl-tRNA(Asn)/glutamyl-tRNA(Gln) amidotransferase subunit A
MEDAMSSLPPDPLQQHGIAGFGRALRLGEVTVQGVTDAYLARIRALNPSLNAFEHVAEDSARSTARALDHLLASGTDLGPMMGVSVAIKDIIAVEGMPTTAGSNLDVADLIGPEGTFVGLLRRAGCVILGKTNTVEFAIGSSGTNYNRGTPRNPWDGETFRLTSGSSSGSAVAIAAGLCGFAIGTDTGGSVRGPAAFCGVFGLKASQGTWPMDGIFPMSKTLDSIGPLTRSAADAALVWSALSGQPAARPTPLRKLRLGRPTSFFFDQLDADVSTCIEAALADIVRSGAEVVEVDIPELSEATAVFQSISRPELVAVFGRERFLASSHEMNPDVADRIAPGLQVTTEAYIRSLWRHKELCQVAERSLREVDAWVGPTKQRVAPAYPGSFTSLAADRALVEQCAGPTRPANVFGLCASTQPIQSYGSSLPVGLQVMCAGGAEAKLLSIALALEQVFGEPTRPNVSLLAAGQSSSR